MTVFKAIAGRVFRKVVKVVGFLGVSGGIGAAVLEQTGSDLKAVVSAAVFNLIAVALEQGAKAVREESERRKEDASNG